MSKSKQTDKFNPLSRINNLSKDQFNQVMTNTLESGPPFFTEADLGTSGDVLLQLLKYLMILTNFNRAKFNKVFEEYQHRSCMDSNSSKNDKGNTLRSFEKSNKISWDSFNKVITLMKYNLVDVKLTLQNTDTNEIIEISKSDVNKIIMKNPYPSNIVIEPVNGVVED